MTRWAPVLGFEGLYEVADDGQVRSLSRVTIDSLGRRRRFPGGLLSTDRATPYVMVALWRSGQEHKRRVHVLVLEAFIGPRPEGMDGCHNDGDPANNRLSNLRWDTTSGNCYDTVRHGRNREAAKLACVHGHLFAGANLHITPRQRRCRSCDYGREIARRVPPVRRRAVARTTADARYRELMGVAATTAFVGA